ncbi:hypothetical protein EVAR_59079_1 [Eumeta japonica]|uniref:Uncharacterized protein n=1 Tax=Eumeta variegata TaxID=151549 RepID=A0A4C1Z0I1_EUMVA|nr:hypothetical protein EVAR_59079_1 [Eumeta japonica]
MDVRNLIGVTITSPAFQKGIRSLPENLLIVAHWNYHRCQRVELARHYKVADDSRRSTLRSTGKKLILVCPSSKVTTIL